MSDADQELLQMATALAAAERSPWQPKCIARAFGLQREFPKVAELTLKPLTLQGWLELDAARSPYLPYAGSKDYSVEALATALSILSGHVITLDWMSKHLPPETAVEASVSVLQVVHGAFETAVQMKPPYESKEPDAGHDGFGGWILLLAWLIHDCKMPERDALNMEVARVYALLSATKRNHGWKVTDGGYLAREV